MIVFIGDSSTVQLTEKAILKLCIMYYLEFFFTSISCDIEIATALKNGENCSLLRLGKAEKKVNSSWFSLLAAKITIEKAKMIFFLF